MSQRKRRPKQLPARLRSIQNYIEREIAAGRPRPTAAQIAAVFAMSAQKTEKYLRLLDETHAPARADLH
jgi:hypothetical protein